MIVTEAMRQKRRQRKPKHTSMAMVSRTGKPAPSWACAPDFTLLANECFRACINPEAKPDLIRVFINNASWALGRCWPDHRLITIAKRGKDKIHTLAHEIAHLRFNSHGKRHAELTETLYEWLKANA